MPTLQVFDRINNLNTDRQKYKLRSLPYEQYFGEMHHLTEDQRKERIELAERLYDVVMFFFYLVIMQSDYAYLGAISSVEAKEEFKRRMTEELSKHFDMDEDMRRHLEEFVEETSRVTIEYLVILSSLKEKGEDTDKEEYFLSDDRARFMAEEESNTFYNMYDYYMAKQLGYTHKTWHTMRDNRVRHSHTRLDEKTLPIDELYMVGESLMRFPRDTYYSASLREIANCRCTITYTK